MMPVTDMWHTTNRPVITDLLHDQLVRRWLYDRQIVTYTAKGQPTKALIDRWGEAMIQTAANWSASQPYMSLHDLPLTRDLLPCVRDWLEFVEASNGDLHGRMALVTTPDMAPLLGDAIEQTTLETAVFSSYSEALAWLKR